MGEFVTQEQHQAAVQRLDAADARLDAQITDVERTLRAEFERKISKAVEDVKEEIVIRTGMNLDAVKAVSNQLTWQNRAVIGSALTGIVTFIVLIASNTIHL